MAWSKWIDLAEDEPDDAPSMPYDLPRPAGKRYSYSTRINLQDAQLKKADLDCTDCSKGDIIDMRCFGEVLSINEDSSVTIQLQKIKVENEDTEDEEDC